MEVNVQKLIAANMISELHYMTWLCNLVMVLKASRGWQMCQDLKHLNQASDRKSKQTHSTLPLTTNLLPTEVEHSKVCLAVVAKESEAPTQEVAPEDLEEVIGTSSIHKRAVVVWGGITY